MGFAICALGGASAGAVALGSPRATVKTNHGCYRIGQRIVVQGSGFAPMRLYDIAIGGVDFGQSRTDGTGGFRTTLIPGGLSAGIVQHVNYLNATDGTTGATTRFTLTRSTGARFLGTGGDPGTLRAPFQAWGFGLDGKSRPVYLHYVRPSGRGRSTSFLGRTGGQCGFLQTRSRQVFPFTPSPGTWKLQLDTVRRYTSRPKGPAARIFVRVS